MWILHVLVKEVKVFAPNACKIQKSHFIQRPKFLCVQNLSASRCHSLRALPFLQFFSQGYWISLTVCVSNVNFFCERKQEPAGACHLFASKLHILVQYLQGPSECCFGVCVNIIFPQMPVCIGSVAPPISLEMVKRKQTGWPFNAQVCGHMVVNPRPEDQRSSQKQRFTSSQ